MERIFIKSAISLIKKAASENGERLSFSEHKVQCLRQVPGDHLPDVFPAFTYFAYYCRLESAVHHALGASGVLVNTIFTPLGLLHHLPVGGIMGVGDQIAGGLPAPGIPGGVSPWGAFQL